MSRSEMTVQEQTIIAGFLARIFSKAARALNMETGFQLLKGWELLSRAVTPHVLAMCP
jgi:hypothetical protein